MKKLGRALAAFALVGTLACATSAEDSKARPEGSTASGSGSEVVGMVGDQKITMDDVDQRGRQIKLQAYVDLHTVRDQALQLAMADVMIQKEAAAKGVSTSDLLQKEVVDKVQPVTDENVEQFYNENKAQMQGQSLEAMSERIKQYLTSQNQYKARESFLDALKKKYNAKVLLEPMRMDVDVAANDPKKGPSDAPVQIVTFSEFQCPFCRRVEPTIEKVMSTYGDKVQLVFQNFPLPMHQNAHMAAEAAECANAQGKFWQYHDKLFANQQALLPDNLKEYAEQIGLDADKFATCLDSGKFKSEVDDDQAAGQRLGVTGTPAFFINGRFLNGAQPFEAFRAIIDDELSRKGVASPAKG